jgi:hypothetical protein
MGDHSVTGQWRDTLDIFQALDIVRRTPDFLELPRVIRTVRVGMPEDAGELLELQVSERLLFVELRLHQPMVAIEYVPSIEYVVDCGKGDPGDVHLRALS